MPVIQALFHVSSNKQPGRLTHSYTHTDIYDLKNQVRAEGQQVIDLVVIIIESYRPWLPSDITFFV